MISDKLSLPYPNDAGIIHKFPIQQKKVYNLSTVYYFQWWSQAESNCRHKDFQSFALPTELQDHWLRGKDLNQRPPGYEPDELPGCSTSRQDIFWEKRRNWDSNPGAGCPTYRFSRPDPSTTWVFLHISGPWRTRTFDQSVMSRQLWPTELRVQVWAFLKSYGSEGETRTHDLPGMNRPL